MGRLQYRTFEFVDLFNFFYFVLGGNWGGSSLAAGGGQLVVDESERNIFSYWGL